MQGIASNHFPSPNARPEHLDAEWLTRGMGFFFFKEIAKKKLERPLEC